MEETQGADSGPIRVAFVAPGCILDTGSGAALSVRSLLEMLAADGFECRSFTPSIFDGTDEFPLRSVLGTGGVEHVGKTVQIILEGVTHQIFRTASTAGGKITEDERLRFAREALGRMQAFRPHILIAYGSSAYTASLMRELRKLTRTFVFYLSNAEIERPELFAPDDVILCPSQAQIALYRQRFGLEPRLLRSPIRPGNAADPERTLAIQAPGSRGQGFVTFINPAPNKGATLVFALAQLALRERPDLTFLVIESRIRKSFWDTNGLLKRDLPNLWWIPNQVDMGRIYERTSALLFPSFWFEVSGRSIAEAQLGGIPVLASRRGGIPEQLNGGGFLFDIPENFRGDTLAVPDLDTVRPWLDTLGRLIDDDQFYGDATRRALEASQPFQWQRQQRTVAALFHGLATA